MKYIICSGDIFLWTKETEEKIRTICELKAKYFDDFCSKQPPLISKGWKSQKVKRSSAIKNTFKIVREDSFNTSKKRSIETSYTIHDFKDIDETLAFVENQYKK